MFEVSLSEASRKVEFFPWRRLNSFFLLVSALLKLVQWCVWASYRVRYVLSFCLFVLPLMGKAEWGGNPVCWWLGSYFCFVCYLDEASCTGCYGWLGDAGSCIQVVSFVWVLTIYSRILDECVFWAGHEGRAAKICSLVLVCYSLGRQVMYLKYKDKNLTSPRRVCLYSADPSSVQDGRQGFESFTEEWVTDSFLISIAA